MAEVRRSTALDISLIAIVAVVLAVIHFLVPDGIQAQLAFDHARFAPWTLLTGAYVHVSNQHLFGNVAGFLIGAGLTYLLCYQQNRRRWFRVTTMAFLLVLPILVNITTYAIFQPFQIEPTSRGFSGIVSGYVGFILAALARDIADRYGTKVGATVGQAIFLVLVGEVALIYMGIPTVTVSVLLLVGLVLSLGQIVLRGVRRDWTEEQRRDVLLDTVVTVLVSGILIAFVLSLFPMTLVQGGNTTNVLAHGAGFLCGSAISIAIDRW